MIYVECWSMKPHVGIRQNRDDLEGADFQVTCPEWGKWETKIETFAWTDRWYLIVSSLRLGKFNMAFTRNIVIISQTRSSGFFLCCRGHQTMYWWCWWWGPRIDLLLDTAQSSDNIFMFFFVHVALSHSHTHSHIVRRFVFFCFSLNFLCSVGLSLGIKNRFTWICRFEHTKKKNTICAVFLFFSSSQSQPMTA